MSHLVLSLLFILIYEPPFSVVAVRHFVGANKLDMAKVFSSLGDDAGDLGGNEHVHLIERERERQREREGKTFETYFSLTNSSSE